MKNDPFSTQFDHALEQLRSSLGPNDLDGFEREVWAEIAIRDERLFPRLRRWIFDGLPTVSTATATGVAAVTMFLGVAMAFFQAEAYGEQASRSMEERYVASIHPVLRSESHAAEGSQPE
ncbi:MAG: hypothetical protein KDN20_21005 [Verrucomicrobiae bacterium]|nr:hypothetical protein [Verrucomicrobiae bacterium]